MTTRVDDRTDAEKRSHVWLVKMHDRFMSGWGHAQGGTSICAWACETRTIAAEVERWVRSRGDARRVHVTWADTYRPPRSCAHFHIYVAKPGIHYNTAEEA